MSSAATTKTKAEHFDVLIVGAGISGRGGAAPQRVVGMDGPVGGLGIENDLVVGDRLQGGLGQEQVRG